MGILAKITGKGSVPSQSTHGINANQVLAPTAPDVINPDNSGNWSSIRTAPINHDPRYFTKEEADGLKQLATEKTDGARHTRRAYRSLRKIEDADAQVHVSHRRYIRGVADSELSKKRADVRTANHLHSLRPEYAKLGMRLENADAKAETRINELKAKIQGK